MSDGQKKALIGILVLFGLYLLICLLFLFENKSYIVVYPGNAYVFSKGKWSSFSLNAILDKEYSAQNEGILSKKALLTNEEVLKYNNEITSEIFLATTGYIENIAFTLEEMEESDLQILNQILIEKGIKNGGSLGIEEKIVLDIDNDGIIETLYSFSNVFTDLSRDKDFSLILLKKQDMLQTIFYHEADVDDLENTCASIIYGLIDVNKDQKYELITGCSYYDQIGVDYHFYSLENGKYVEM